MANNLTKQDVEVLDKINEYYPKGIDYQWHNIIKRAVVLARQTETQRCKKEIDGVVADWFGQDSFDWSIELKKRLESKKEAERK